MAELMIGKKTKNKRKHILNFIIILAVVILVSGFIDASVYAIPFEPGVSGDATTQKVGETKYSEIVFVSGEALLFTGKAAIAVDTTGKTTFTATLTNAAKKGTLSRKFVFNAIEEKNTSGGQTLRTYTLEPGFSETIKVGNDSYVLTDYYFSGSSIADDRALIKYTALSWNGKKVYSKAGVENALEIDINTENNGYVSDWSSTAVSLVDMQYTWNIADQNTGTSVSKVGTAKVAVSETKTKLFEYIPNTAISMSFSGGYTIKSTSENTIAWKSDLPDLNSAAGSEKRKKEKSSSKVTTVPVQNRFFVPIIKDVANNYWAVEPIKKMSALDIVSTKENKYFRPLAGISKAELAKAMVKLGNLKTEGTGSVARLPYGVKFDDVTSKHPLYKYILAAVNTEMMEASSPRKFSPESYVTRSYAIKTIIGAFGFEDNSTESSVATPFSDDELVPADEKKAMNIGYSMGIITPDEYSRIEPDRRLTRAEAVDMLLKLIKYLEYDIRKDYKEKVVDFIL